ncbi:MAG: DUF4145 domain-containing protein [Ferruginibacter sp.]|nr:DUF4145 domain-containing protein [Rhodoferax sp.]
MPDQLKKDKSTGHSVEVACAGTCSGITHHAIMASMDRGGSNEHIDWWSHYQVIMCQGCKTLSFRQASGTSEDYEQIGEDEWVSNESVQLYPARKTDSLGLGDDVIRLPDTIARLYEETRTTLLNATPVLTGIGLRALVETVCKEKKAPGDNLQKRIDGLVEMGVLTKADADVLHEIRSMGNDAAHEAKPHPDEQLFLAMEVVEHLLKSVYIIPFKLAKFAKPKLP